MMRRKAIVFILSASLALASVSSAAAEEIVVDDNPALMETALSEEEDILTEEILEEENEIPEESGEAGSDVILMADEDEDITQPSSELENTETSAAENSDGGEGGNVECADDSLLDGFVLDIEEIVTEDEESGQYLEETVVVPLEESGVAENTGLPLFSLFADAEYIDSYGGQLEGLAREVYESMEQVCREVEATYAEASAAYTGTEGESLPTFTYTLEEPMSCHLTSEEYEDKTKREENEDYADMVALLKYPMQAAYDAYIFDHPEAYWMGPPSIAWTAAVSGNASDGYTYKISSVKVLINENYTGFISAISDYNTEVQAAIDEIQGALPESASRLETVKAIHDYLCERLIYDSDYGTYVSTSVQYKYIHSAAGAFVSGENKVVCDGYSKSFKILCSKFGIDCAVIPGVAGGPHAWNYVEMEDGNWYLVDVTWDDQEPVSYSYFLIGSQTVPSGTASISEARTVYTNFSEAVYTMSFVVPVLQPIAYHVHSFTNYVPNEDGTTTAVCDFEGCEVTDTEDEAETETEIGTEKESETETETETEIQTETQTETEIETETEIQTETETETEAIPDPGSGHTHTPGAWTVTKAATCTAAGTQVRKCTVCGAIAETQTIPAKGHTPGAWTVTKAATCTAAGTQVKKCTVCGAIAETQTIPAKGHTPGAWTVTKAATCTAAGTQVKKCTVCGAIVETQAIAALGHTWGAWQTVSAATVSAPAVRMRKCTRCGQTETATVGTKLTPTITLNAASITLKVKQSTKAVTVKGLAAGDSVKSWSSSKPKVVSVNSRTGKITGKKAGTAYVTVTLRSGKTAKIKVKVQKTKVKTKKISGIRSKVRLKKGAKLRLKPVLSPITSQEKITYSSSNKKVAAVSSKGVITGKKKGTATITVKSGSKKVKCKVTVTK